MPDLQATPVEQPWALGLGQLLEKVRAMAQAQAGVVEEGGGRNRPAGMPSVAMLLRALGGLTEGPQKAMEGVAYGEPVYRGGKATIAQGLMPGLAETAGDLAQALPMGKVAAAAKMAAELATAKGVLSGGAVATMLGRPALIQLAKTDSAAVEKLEAARIASEAVHRAGGSLDEAWVAGSKHLEGTPYAGWRPAEDGFPAMFEVSDEAANLVSLPPLGVVRTGDLGASYKHAELEKFLPDMPYFPSKIARTPSKVEGWHFPKNNEIRAAGPDRGVVQNVLVHEGQHAAADRYGLPAGSSPEAQEALLKKLYPELSDNERALRAFMNYENDPGELLARMAQERELFSAGSRRRVPIEGDLAMQYTDPAFYGLWKLK